ncbi:MAG TPA: ThuA domain-containing protein [Pedobacter sp.]|nr:ThuA domain-containing protein [Pedobacter sp.]
MRNLKSHNVLAAFFFLIALLFSFNTEAKVIPKQAKVLIFSFTKGFRHGSIKEGILAIKKLGNEKGLDVEATEDVNAFTSENLKKYKLLVFLSPTGSDVFTADQKDALKWYINNGGGLVGIHAATDFCYEWEWYGKMIGGYFENHPAVQKVKLDIVMPKNKMVKGLPQPWMHTDEWYNFKNVNPDIKVLIKADETSYKGGTMKNNHPVSWYHEFDGGKVFYTALGHTNECFVDPLFLTHLWAGMKWAMK